MAAALLPRKGRYHRLRTRLRIASMWPRHCCRGKDCVSVSETFTANASMWPRHCCRGKPPTATHARKLSSASMWPRHCCRGKYGYMPSGWGFDSASMWPRHCCRGKDSQPRHARCERRLQCGRGIAAAERLHCLPLQCRGHQQASMWPRHCCRGKTVFSPRTAKAMSARFNVAAALLPRKGVSRGTLAASDGRLQCGRGIAAAERPKPEKEPKKMGQLQCGRGIAAAERPVEYDKPPKLVRASMWPRHCCRGKQASRVECAR